MALCPAGPAALAAIILGAAALSAGAAAAPAPRTHTVTMADMAFGPPPKGVRVGDTIVWVNNDIFRHTATERTGAFDVDLAPKKSARTVVRKAGETLYYCRFHPGMTVKFTAVK